jgi:hypothetical protein
MHPTHVDDNGGGLLNGSSKTGSNSAWRPIHLRFGSECLS